MKVNATVVANMACNDFMLGQMICTDYPRTQGKHTGVLHTQETRTVEERSLSDSASEQI